MLPPDSDAEDPVIADAISRIEKALNMLTERERALVDRSALDAILSKLTDYIITNGQNSTWQKGADFSLSFSASGEYAKFVSVMIDGVLLNSDCYTAVERNTVINLSPAYLETLAVGKHTIQIVYTDGEADGQFTIMAAPTVTNGNSYLWLIILIIVLCIAGGVCAVYFVMKKEQNVSRRF